MRQAQLLASVVMVAVAARGDAGAKPQAPRGLPPRFVVVQTVGEREVTLRELLVVPEIVMIGGKPGLEPSTAPEQWRWEDLRFSLERDEVYDVKGKRVPARVARRRLVPGRVVLLSADGKRVDPLYLRVVKEDTAILVAKAAPPG